MKINPNVRETLENQYLQPGETPEGMLRRVANYVALAEENYMGAEDREKLADAYYDAMNEGLFLPSSPFLMNAGTKVPMLSACFVVGVKDSMESIFTAIKDAAIIHKMGGGTGFDFSSLRGTGTPIRSTGGTSSGVLSFLSIFNAEAEAVKQGGRRRAANMGTLRVDHPDILEFIQCKNDKAHYMNFNLSVLVPDYFMKAVENDEEYELQDPVYGPTGTKLKAREVFDLIVTSAWNGAEPGVIFLDTVNNNPYTEHLGKITCTNPCGEIPLLPGEACNLASINLDNFVDDDGNMDWNKLVSVTRLVTRFLDSAIDVNAFPLESIKQAVLKTRKLGVGIMGLHGALIKMGFEYESIEGREVAAKIMSTIEEAAFIMSKDLAELKGTPEGWEGSKWAEDGVKVRNMTRITIAPTGTISMLLDASSSGCEPIFSIMYKRLTRGIEYTWINPLFKEIAEKSSWYNSEVEQKILDNGGVLTGIDEIPESVQRLFKTAGEISPKGHVLMQAALQEYVDNSISKTVNMPNSATVDDVKEIYMLAWKKGCKGITVYRDGSLQGVLNTIKDEKKEDVHLEVDPGVDPKTLRPETLLGVTTKIQSGCGKIWVTINPYKDRVWEVFASAGAEGGCNSNIQEISRLCSLLFREGVDKSKILDQLRSVKCPHAIASKHCNVKSCSDAIARQIEAFLDKFDPAAWEQFRLSLANGSAEPELPAPKAEAASEENPILADMKHQGCRNGKCE